jgi:diguanylate cyclase (GGDEF)-like protein
MSVDNKAVGTILENMGVAILVVDKANHVSAVSGPINVAIDFSRDEVVGHPIALFDEAESSSGLHFALNSARKGGVTWQGTVRLKGKSGDTRGFLATITPNENGQCAVVLFEHSNLAEETGSKPGYDELTDLPDRNLFFDRTEQALLNARRANKSVALLYMGIDRFTMINDAMGHLAGDLALRQVADRLKACVRNSDTVARLDGDRFAIITPITAEGDSVIVAEKVIKAHDSLFDVGGQKVSINFSIGISIFPTDSDSANDLFKNAESAMRHAKANGRGGYQFFANEMNQKAKARLTLENNMRRAVVNSEFVVYYQPKIEAATSLIRGMEALVRWKDPERGLVPPGEFIPVAEETGMIEDIGSFVLREACLQNRTWQDMGLGPLRVAVNVSARQFRAKNLVDKVLAVLDESRLSPHSLELEITESMLMNDVESAVRKMEELRNLGIHLSIDDFGTGYSSLSYLGRFPITCLKIDRAFVQDVQTNANTAEIARAIIGLSRGLNLEVVAEGAELIEHVNFLKDNGCDTIQGFYFSKPLPPAEFQALLVKQMEA